MKPNLIYSRVCLFFFLLASCVGLNFALSYRDFVHENNWAAWRPGIGIALLFVSMLISFIGVQRAGNPTPQKGGQHKAGTDVSGTPWANDPSHTQD